MKKQLLLLAFLAGSFCSLQAQVPYTSGKIAAIEDFELPSFWGGENTGIAIRTGMDTSKGTYAEFAAAIGIASDATQAQGIKIGRTDGENGTASGYAELTLPECGTITVTFWGTGARGIAIKTDLDGEDLEWFGGASYIAHEVSADINSTEPVKIYLVPTGKDNGTSSTGDTYIAEFTITAAEGGGGGTDGIKQVEKNVVSNEYFNVAGLSFQEAQQGLNIVKTTYEDGSVKVTKEYIK